MVEERHLVSARLKLYSLFIMDQNDVLSNVARMTSELASHVRDAFGPMGKHVVVVDDVGKVTLTKNGFQILKALRCVDPLARMIVRSISSLVDMVSTNY